MAKVEIIGNQLVLAEDLENGSNKAVITAPSSLTNDVALRVPTTGGTIATQEYVTANAGGGITASVGKNTAGQTTTTTTFANVTNCSVTLEAGKTYRLSLYIHATTNHTSSNVKYKLNVSSGAIASEIYGLGVASVATTYNGAQSGQADAKSFLVVTNTSLIYNGYAAGTYFITGNTLVVADSAGATINLQFGQQTSQAASEEIYQAWLVAEKLD